jgi:hypothetical protein
MTKAVCHSESRKILQDPEPERIGHFIGAEYERNQAISRALSQIEEDACYEFLDKAYKNK